MQLLGSYLSKQDWDAVIAICEDGTRYTPAEMMFYYYEGLAYYQQDRRDEALGSFQRGVAQVKPDSNAELVADLYYFMGDLPLTTAACSGRPTTCPASTTTPTTSAPRRKTCSEPSS